ncbi:MAG: winged helix-turn-helix transcriptional regulator [Chitinophagaceae bacterium]|nr:winged helix-turn-helix transcriptional regulator [Chitinophagaceae bacterium]
MIGKYVNDMRSFNRFYTGILGLLNTHILESRFSLPEVRILYELYHNNNHTARHIIDILHIDKGLLSRMLVKFEKEKLIAKIRSSDDKRAVLLSLTKKGIAEFEILNKASNDQVMQLFKNLDDQKLTRLTHHMKEIQRILSAIK